MADTLLGINSSARGRKWVMRARDAQNVQALASTGLDLVIADLLAARGVMAADAQHFLNPTLRHSLPDPSSLLNMDKASSLILDAVQSQKKITVFADYDVDGGTSAAQLIRWGRGIGHDFGLYVPDRIKEGFGPTPQTFTTLKEDGVDLVITVDCGAAATQALIHAASIELDVIVIDHHLMDGGTPPCAALVNPNQPDDHSGLGYLSAAGVTFMLLVALNREARRRGLETPDLLKFLDLTALGTVCDVMPLTGLNRVFVAQGMKVLENTPNPGLKALIEVANSEPPFTPYHAGFIIGPRINAGGRIGRADMGARLLSSDDPAEISEFARILDQTNVERRAIQEDMLREAVDKIEGRELGHELICIAQENWHAGIIGVVAGRLKDKYERPAIVIGIDETGIGKGSGRSLKGVNLGAAIQAAKQDGLLLAGGGHEMAAGLTIEREKIDDFTAFMNARLARDIEIATQNLTTKIDALLSASGATPELIAKINSLGPFGTGNPEPVFVFPDMRITYAKALNGGHIRCAFEDSGGQRISGIAFRAEDNGIADILMHQDTARVHVVGRIKQDTWNGRTKIDLQVSDIALAASD